MTKRRLLNKKSYDELLLLQQLLKDDDVNYYEISVQVSSDGNERFVVNHYVDNEFRTKIVGENYTNISKILIQYLSKLS